MALIAGAHLHHIARESDNVEAMAAFYEEILGFKRIDNPGFGSFKVVWLSLPPCYSLHLIEREPNSSLPEGPFSATADCRKGKIPNELWRGHHLAFSVADYDAAAALLKEKEIAIFEKTQQEGKIKQAFFFDPDGNGIEIGNWPAPSP